MPTQKCPAEIAPWQNIFMDAQPRSRTSALLSQRPTMPEFKYLCRLALSCLLLGATLLAGLYHSGIYGV
jgi:hypothetical protein